MEIELWECLDMEWDDNKLEESLVIQIKRDLEYVSHYVDNEGVLKAKINIMDLEDLLIIKSIVEDDIVLYGTDNGLVMSKLTMAELGLS